MKINIDFFRMAMPAFLLIINKKGLEFICLGKGGAMLSTFSPIIDDNDDNNNYRH